MGALPNNPDKHAPTSMKKHILPLNFIATSLVSPNSLGKLAGGGNKGPLSPQLLASRLPGCSEQRQSYCWRRSSLGALCTSAMHMSTRNSPACQDDVLTSCKFRRKMQHASPSIVGTAHLGKPVEPRFEQKNKRTVVPPVVKVFSPRQHLVM